MSKSKAKKARELNALIDYCVKSSEERRKDPAEQKRWRESYVAALREGNRSTANLSNTVVGVCVKKSIDDTKWKSTYRDNEELQAREIAAQKEVDLKRKQVAPAYNKGPVMLITDKRDWKTAGRKV